MLYFVSVLFQHFLLASRGCVNSAQDFRGREECRTFVLQETSKSIALNIFKNRSLFGDKIQVVKIMIRHVLIFFFLIVLQKARWTCLAALQSRAGYNSN
jgi:hypothetical protein